ncbi:MAG: SAM-dependent methyltransferase [Pseudonocardiaceae bacterium]
MLNDFRSRMMSALRTCPPVLDQHHHPVIDTRKPNAARVWNYWLGGKDHYPIDRMLGAQIRVLIPDITDIACASRGFLHRAVRHLAAEVGLRQFLDIGPGLPTRNTHHIAQGIAPDCRIVYVDHDPLVLAHARALLISTPQGRIGYLDAELGEPEKILAHATRTLDLTRPVALLVQTLHPLLDDASAHAIVTRLLDALPAGSYLLLVHPTAVLHPAAMLTATRLWNAHTTPAITTRTPHQLTHFFDRMELLEPGIVSCPLWRPSSAPISTPIAVDTFGAVGRKPDNQKSLQHTRGLGKRWRCCARDQTKEPDA